ncbi:uncharacterized protein LOC134539751 isoform X1 [Bacillus rossius redtenbacheri]|uniref:uncharacterized protein LOC134539751 isoform X1 n=1 Tax=Bacillus rossius redtenbacheri TaxID=93214 RepID=UPI002FDECE13
MQTGEASSDESREPESPPATPRELGMIKEEIPTLRAIDRIFKRVPAAAKDYHVRATCAAMEAAMLDIREMEYELEFFAKDHVLCRELAADEDYQARTTCAAMETAMLDIREMDGAGPGDKPLSRHQAGALQRCIAAGGQVGQALRGLLNDKNQTKRTQRHIKKIFTYHRKNVYNVSTVVIIELNGNYF